MSSDLQKNENGAPGTESAPDSVPSDAAAEAASAETETAAETEAAAIDWETGDADANDPFAALAVPVVREAKDLTLSKKKKKRILLISLIAAPILLCTLIVLLMFVFPQKKDADTPSDSSETSITITDKTSSAEKTSIRSATLQFDEKTVEIVNKDDALFVKGYEALPVHTVNMSALQSVLTTYTATDDLGERPDTAEYGFDAPRLTGQATYLDDSTYLFELGDMTPDQNGYYFREAGSFHVYIVSANVGAVLLQEPLDYISTTVFAQPKADTDDANAEIVMRNMTLGGASRKDKNFSFRLVTSEDSDTFLYYDYIITSPYLKGANSSASSGMQGFTSLEATAVIAAYPTAEELKTYGFDDPSTVATFTLACKTTTTGADDSAESVTKYSNLQEHTIRLGGMYNDYYYTMIDDQPIIYLAAASSLPFAALQYDDFADSLLFLDDITNISTFTVETPDKRTAFQLKHDPSINDNEKNLTVTADGKTYDTMGFRHLMQNFMNVSRYSALTKDISGLPLQLTLTITHTGETEPALTIRFYELSSSRSAVVLSNGERYQVKASAVKNVITQWQNLLDGKTVLY